MMMVEAAVTVPAGTGEPRPDPRMREACAAKGGTADMGEARAAHPADMHAAKAAGAHPAATEMTTTTEMATTTEAAMSATAASGEHR
ncbi:hypothetical protein XI01_19825 [Bradyrhizobium sp. CCBAU 21360]|nr:hypothetical protein [Bradyrhizobium sp. CCBAU 21360]